MVTEHQKEVGTAEMDMWVVLIGGSDKGGEKQGNEES